MATKMIFIGALIAGSVIAAPAISNPASSTSVVNETICNGQTYIYESFAGYGYTPSDSRDKFGDTAGGIGSSAAIDPRSWTKKGNTYSGIIWTLPDRGWNTEGTVNFQPRVHKFGITFTPNNSATAQDPSGPNVQLQYLDTVRFVDPAGAPLTGLDADATGPYLSFPGFPDLPSATYTGDGFGNAGPGGHRVSLDSEGLVLNADNSFWVSDEYGPYVYHFSPTGKMLSAIAPPPAIIPRRNSTVSFSAASPPLYEPNLKISPTNPKTGRANNQGLEGLTASPDGKTLYALMQSALDQEGGVGSSSATRSHARFLSYDVSNPGSPVYKSEYIVPLPFYSNNSKVAAQSEIHYITPTQFLVLARDSGAGHGQSKSTSLYRHADVFDISSATDIKSSTADCATCSVANATTGILNPGVIPATYCSFLDYNVNSELGKFGLHNGGAQDAKLLNEKWESLALVPVNPHGGGWEDWEDDGGKGEEYFIFSLSDNDFITQNGYIDSGLVQYKDESGYNLDNQVLVFKVRLPAGAKPRVG